MPGPPRYSDVVRGEEDPNKHRQGSHDDRRNPHEGRGDRVDSERRSKPRYLPESSYEQTLAFRPHAHPEQAKTEHATAYMLDVETLHKYGEPLADKDRRHLDEWRATQFGDETSHQRRDSGFDPGRSQKSGNVRASARREQAADNGRTARQPEKKDARLSESERRTSQAARPLGEDSISPQQLARDSHYYAPYSSRSHEASGQSRQTPHVSSKKHLKRPEEENTDAPESSSSTLEPFRNPASSDNFRARHPVGASTTRGSVAPGTKAPSESRTSETANRSLTAARQSSNYYAGRKHNQEAAVRRTGFQTQATSDNRSTRPAIPSFNQAATPRLFPTPTPSTSATGAPVPQAAKSTAASQPSDPSAAGSSRPGADEGQTASIEAHIKTLQEFARLFSAHAEGRSGLLIKDGDIKAITDYVKRLQEYAGYSAGVLANQPDIQAYIKRLQLYAEPLVPVMPVMSKELPVRSGEDPVSVIERHIQKLQDYALVHGLQFRGKERLSEKNVLEKLATSSDARTQVFDRIEHMFSQQMRSRNTSNSNENSDNPDDKSDDE